MFIIWFRLVKSLKGIYNYKILKLFGEIFILNNNIMTVTNLLLNLRE